jgi:hypothetical protein
MDTHTEELFYHVMLGCDHKITIFPFEIKEVSKHSIVAHIYNLSYLENRVRRITV